MAKTFNAPKGTQDVLPDYHDFFTFLKKVVRHRFRQSGFRRITPPVFEETELFGVALGEDTNIFQHELYTFEDRHGRKFSLRPEVTTGVVRSFIEHDMHEQALPVELYYIERCFRFERPKSKTFRQFWQFGAEVIGEIDPSIDAQLIYLGHRILSDFRIRDKCTLRVNSVGTPEDRKKYFDALENFYAGKERSLTPGTREKLEKKRFFDALVPANEDEEVLLNMAPKITEYLSKESQAHFEQMLEYLNEFQIPYEVDIALTRPVEYSTHTIFEFAETENRNKLLVGGRYDSLLPSMGGPDVGGAGFAGGVERIIDCMQRSGLDVPHKDDLQIFLAATGKEAKKKALPLLVALREHGYHAVGVLGKTSMQEQLKRAEKFKVPYTLLIGDVEVQKNQIIVRDMKTGTQEWIAWEDMIPHMDSLMGGAKALDTTKDFLGHN